MNYLYFSDFIKDLRKKLTEYAITLNLSKAEQERKEFEMISRNIGRNTRFKIIEKNFKNLNETLEYLLDVEKQIILKIKESNLEKSRIEEKFQKMSISNDLNFKKQNKYCPIHKSNSHSKDEYFFYKMRKENKHEKYKKKFEYKPKDETHNKKTQHMIVYEEKITYIDVAEVSLQLTMYPQKP